MNYGYRAPEGDRGAAAAAARERRRGRSLVHPALRLVARGAPVAGRELLEVGCGRGGGAAYVARALDPRRVVAVDLSPRAVALCRRRFAHPRLSFEVGDAERLPFDDAIVRRRAQRRVVALLRALRRASWARSAACCAPAGISSTPTFARAASSPAGAHRCVPPASRSTPSAISARASSRRWTPTRPQKRDLIARLVDRPLAGIFGEFAALQGSELNAALRRGDFGYRAFVLTPALRASGGPRA